MPVCLQWEEQMANLKCSAIVKNFGADRVLNEVSLEVASGDFLVILGPSGCGKSTLLRIIAGIEHQDAGTIAIDDDVIDNIHPRHRNVAMVFQNYALYPLMTVFDNMAFSLRIRKLPEDEIKQRIHDIAEIIGISDQLEKRPAHLSGGQRQRVAMGRAMVRDPRVFLFDEPLSNLDARLRAKMRGEIKQLHIKLKTTTVYVTHDQIEAMTMGDRIAVMRNSVIEQNGTPDEIFTQPATLHVATFIGSPEINNIVTSVTNNECKLGEQGLPMPHTVPDGEVHYCIRPHDLEIAAAAGDGVIAGTVEFVEPTGSYSIIHAGFAGKSIVAQVDPDEATNLKVGDDIFLKINPSKVHLFDKQTQQRL